MAEEILLGGFWSDESFTGGLSATPWVSVAGIIAGLGVPAAGLSEVAVDSSAVLGFSATGGVELASATESLLAVDGLAATGAAGALGGVGSAAADEPDDGAAVFSATGAVV